MIQHLIDELRRAALSSQYDLPVVVHLPARVALLVAERLERTELKQGAPIGAA